MTYQGTIRDGEIVTPGERECASRYDAIRPVLDRYRRRFTVLDLGADCGYFGQRIARDYDAVSVMVEGGPQLAETCKRERPERCIALQRRMSVEDLGEMAACEHFDFVLALNVLHHFGGKWERALRAVLGLGDHVVIETPPPDDGGACGQEAIPGIHAAVSRLRPKLLAETPSHTSEVLRPLWLLIPWTAEARLTKPYVDAPAVVCPADVRIESNPTERTVTFPGKDESRPWIHGINLQTYLRRGGVYPSRERIAAMVSGCGLPDEHHGDIRPWNYILDGDRVHLIDGRDAKAIYDDREGLTCTLAAVREEVAA